MGRRRARAAPRSWPLLWTNADVLWEGVRPQFHGFGDRGSLWVLPLHRPLFAAPFGCLTLSLVSEIASTRTAVVAHPSLGRRVCEKLRARAQMTPFIVGPRRRVGTCFCGYQYRILLGMRGRPFTMDLDVGGLQRPD